MIGKMADEKEFDEKAGNSDSEEQDDDDEEITNGKNDIEEDESEFDDPEGFVDDITDEGKTGMLYIQHRVGFRGKTEANLRFHQVLFLYLSVQSKGQKKELSS